MVDKTTIVFCSVVESVNDRGSLYIEQQRRLVKSIENAYSGDCNWMTNMYTNSLPPNAKPFLESLYGFKVHAIQAARAKGYTKICWVDSAIILHKPIPQDLPPVVAIKDDCKLPASDRALNYFGYTRDQISDFHLVGGSFYYFDFNHPITEMIFGYWRQAEAAGIFGSQREESFEGLQGHRHDETCLALSMYSHGYKPLPPDVVGYNDTIMSKRHFK